jgi:hypothetical protein
VPRQELGRPARPQVWLTLLVGRPGFGGFFAVYSYISPTLTEVSGYSESGVPRRPRAVRHRHDDRHRARRPLADWSVVRTMYLGLGSTAVVLAAFPFTAGGVVTAGLSVLLISVTGSLCLPALQTRLMDVAGDAQTLAAAGQHAALNVANALGAWLGRRRHRRRAGVDGARRRGRAARGRRARRAHGVHGAGAADGPVDRELVRPRSAETGRSGQVRQLGTSWGRGRCRDR